MCLETHCHTRSERSMLECFAYFGWQGEVLVIRIESVVCKLGVLYSNLPRSEKRGKLLATEAKTVMMAFPLSESLPSSDILTKKTH